ncbi:MAG: N-acetylmuramoyl-L-alanine amidase family protein [Candidatus Heimdallarchaeaceae archaeon]
MKKYTIVIDPGHGGKDPGAVYAGYKEKDIVLPIALYLGGFLSNMVNCIYTRTADIYVPLRDRVFIANSVKADAFVSIHVNASPKHNAKGEEIWIYPGSIKSAKLADNIATFIDEIVPGKFRGIKEGNFYVLRKTKMPAVLIEVGFIDNPLLPLHSSDAQIKAAFLINNGIKRYLLNIE